MVELITNALQLQALSRDVLRRCCKLRALLCCSLAALLNVRLVARCSRLQALSSL